MAQGKRELYEILSRGEKRAPLREASETELAGEEAEPSGETPPGDESPAPRPDPLPAPAPRVRTPSEIVLSPEAAFAIFLFVVVALATAFHLGRQHGHAELVSRMEAQLQVDSATIPHAPNARPPEGFSETRSRPVAWPAEAYVLKLISYPKTETGRTRALADLEYATGHERLADAGLEAAVLENGMYSVCVGAARGRNDKRLATLRRVFRTLPGPPSSREKTPYAGLSIERVERLGSPVSR